GRRPVQGHRRRHATHHPGRADRAGRPDPVRDLRPADDEARPGLLAAGHLAAPRGARAGRAGAHPAAGPLQVPPHRHGAAARDRRAVARRPRGPGPV
ncbi:MAG: Transcriptional regulator, ArsR family, partial [uncultured Pseudonocardia sp.]